MSDAVARLNAALEGRYAIERELGEGGMATVYLADDIKHERKVALKVLKPELAAVVGAERFLAEIKTTANLQHPHILPLFDSGEADGFLFYVMPFIEGETLQDRIDREKQLPVDEAVRIATAVASALQTAHDQGIVHRDIKPANILLSRGEPLIADFGIALAVGAAGEGRLTETGLSLGTPYYMSPEQATGDQAVGASTDTYALGSVLYEMLIGEPPYPGATAQAVLGKIIAGKPVSTTEQRPSIPANVDAAVRKALEKLPADRFTSAQDLVRALGDEHFRYGELATVGGDVGVGPWKRLTILGWSAAAALTVVVGWLLLRPELPGPVTRISVRMPEGQGFHPSRGDFDLSSDGSLLVYLGVGDEGQRQLWARRWDALDGRPIPDTDNATRPAISPDGREVAFQRASSIPIVPLEGGVSRELAVVTSALGGIPAWSPDGAWIYFTNPSQGLSRLPSGGGTAEIVTEVDTAAGDRVHSMVHVLPGKRAVYQVDGIGGAEPRIQAVEVETGEVKDLTTGRAPVYSTTGHLLYQDATEATLLAAPFDVKGLEITGAALPLAEGLLLVGFGNVANVGISQTGRLVYRAGGSAGVSFTPVWVERDGRANEIDPSWDSGRAGFAGSGTSLSPDGTRLAISTLDSEGVIDVWVKQLETGPLSRISLEGVSNVRATWSPDGESLTFVSNRAVLAELDLWTKRSDGGGTAELVLDREVDILESVYSPDGTWLIFREGLTSSRQGDIYAIRPGIDSVAVALVATASFEHSPAISPNSRWLAYVSDRSGREEVYVSPFPDTGSGVTLVSADGGAEPVWAHSGTELFYRSAANELVSVQVNGDATFAAGPQEVLFSMVDYLFGDGHAMYDVSLDDQRFVMLRSGADNDDTQLILVENWVEALRERAGN